jgi:hypothetical protein
VTVVTQSSQPVSSTQDTAQSPTDSASTVADPSSDIWSTAFHEAVEKFEKGADDGLREEKSLQNLFAELIEVDKSVVEHDAFLRGVKILERAQGPLETLKMALDVTAPIASIEPTAALVVGIVRSVTVVSPSNPTF